MDGTTRMRCFSAIGYMLQSGFIVAMLLVCHASSKDGQNQEHHNRHRHHNGETNRKGKWKLVFEFLTNALHVRLYIYLSKSGGY